MSNPLKILASQTAIYGVSSIVGRALNYLLVPLYTAILAESEYGIVGELYAYAALFNVLYLLGLETAYFRFANKEGANEKHIFNLIQSTIFVSSSIISTLLIVFSTNIAVALHIGGLEKYIIWLAIILFIDAIVAIPFAQLRFYNKAKQYATIKLLNIGLNIAFNLIFLVVFSDILSGKYASSLLPFVALIYHPEYKAGYVFLANLIANAMYIPLLFRSFSRWKFTFVAAEIKPLLHYSYPLMFAAMAGIINETIDRAFLKFLTPSGMYEGFSNQAVVGIYNACYKLSIFMTLGIQAFRYAAEPFFFSQAKDKNSPQLFAKIMLWFTVIAAFIFLCISLNVGWIAALFIRGEGFRSGLGVVPILLLANLFLGIYYNLSIWFKLTEKTHWGTILALFGAIITILGNILLIPKIGYMGSAYTTLGCYAAMAVLSYIFGQKNYPVPYPLAKIIGIIALSIGLYFLFQSLQNFWYNLIAPFWFLVGVYIIIEKKRS